MKSRVAIAAIATLSAATAMGTIEEWGHDQAAQYVIDPFTQKVWIYAPPAGPSSAGRCWPTARGA
jgi:hypothetical protein